MIWPVVSIQTQIDQLHKSWLPEGSSCDNNLLVLIEHIQTVNALCSISDAIVDVVIPKIYNKSTITWVKAAVDQSIETVRVYLDFFHCFGLTHCPSDQILQFLDKQVLYCLCNLWTKANKDWYSRRFAEYTFQPVPPTLGFNNSLPKYLEDFVKLKAIRQRRHRARWSFLTSLLHGLKKGLPMVPTADFKKAAEDMKTCLTQKKTIPKAILDTVTRTSYEVFVKGNDDPPEDNYISDRSSLKTSSVTEGGCSVGGVLGHHLRNTFSTGSSDCPFDNWRKNITILCGGICPLLGYTSCGDSQVFNGCPVEIYGCPATIMDISDLPNECDDKELLHVFLIPEPAKIRPITVGSYSSAASGQSVLRWMRRGLTRFPQFQLTHQEITPEIVTSLLRRMGWWDVARSADYSGATNEFAFDLSRAACDAFPEPIRSRVIKSLCSEKEISFNWGQSEFANCSGGRVKTNWPSNFTQTNGQLMGCIYSFPILCVVNLAILRHTMERHNYDGSYREEGSYIPLNKVHCLVNGDDLLFVARPKFIKKWETVVSDAGLILSPGKNYDSNEFLVMNSQLYTFRREFPPGEAYEPENIYVDCVPDFVNMGLITGRQKGYSDEQKFVDNYHEKKFFEEGWTDERIISTAWWTNLESTYANCISLPLLYRVSEVAEGWLKPCLDRLSLYSEDFFPHKMNRLCEISTVKFSNYQYWKCKALVSVNKPPEISFRVFDLEKRVACLPDTDGIYTDTSSQYDGAWQMFSVWFDSEEERILRKLNSWPTPNLRYQIHRSRVLQFIEKTRQDRSLVDDNQPVQHESLSVYKASMPVPKLKGEIIQEVYRSGCLNKAINPIAHMILLNFARNG